MTELPSKPAGADIVERMQNYIHGEPSHMEAVPEVLALAIAEIERLRHPAQGGHKTPWDSQPHICSVCRQPIEDKADHVAATRLMHIACAASPQKVEASWQPNLSAVEALARHFIVQDGPNAATSQYGHLELWWAAKSVTEPPDAMKNPWMMLGEARGSYSLAPMAELQGILQSLRRSVPLQEVTENDHG